MADKVEELVEATEPVASGEIPKSSEAQLAELQQQLTNLTQKYEQTDKSLRSATKTLNEKDILLKRREDYESRIGGIEDRIDLLATAIAMGKSTEVESEEVQQAKPDVLKAIQQKKAEQDTERARKQAFEVVNGYRQRIEALGFNEDNEEYWELRDLVESYNPNNLKRVDIRLKKLESIKEKEVVSEKTKPVEDEEIKFSKRLQEEKKKWMQENNLLETEVASPSGKSSSFKELQARYAAGEISTEVYQKARKEAGIK